MLIDTKRSPYAKAAAVPQENIHWRNGFWKERFDLCGKVTIPHILGLFEDKNVFHTVENFRIAAGESSGSFRGTPYGDGDFYKLLEGMMYFAAQTNDRDMEDQLNEYIALIGRAQQEDGYLSTKQIIGERQGNGRKRFGDINDFEVYNFGHLFTAACQHKRITGKDSFLQIAVKAAGYLEKEYQEASKTGAGITAVCPSHYMGLVELYRTTGDIRYLDLAKLAVSLRDAVPDGTDDNQDRYPLREHTSIVGHAVRSTYLYAGVADLYLETGDESLKAMLYRVWHNMAEKKLYLTGGCGALYNGVSPYGDFTKDQKVHQAFGYEYQLPNITAYNETCGALGNILWNYRMFAIEPRARYFDLIERSMYNLALAAISLDGDQYFYENMLRRTKKLDFKLIWPRTRSHVLKCFCCPANLSRFLMEAMEYTYAIGEEEVYLGMYGASEVKIRLKNGSSFTMIQDTDYPWSGRIRFRFVNVESDRGFLLMIRVPGWAESGSVEYDGTSRRITEEDGSSYLPLKVHDLKNSRIEVCFDMPARLTVAHPMVEEDGNQAAVERGPIVYCMESPDADVDTLDDILMPSDAVFREEDYEICGQRLVALKTEAVVLRKKQNRDALYQTLRIDGIDRISVRLIPYFAWDNRGFGEMRIWMPLLYRL